MRRPVVLAATALTALLAIYIALVAGRALALLSSDSLTGKALGAAFLVLPAIGAWYLWHEWSLGFAVQRMTARLEEAGRLPVHEGPRTPSGKLTDEAAHDVYEVAMRGVELEPESWIAWYHLAAGYAVVGDRVQSRKAYRYAWELARKS